MNPKASCLSIFMNLLYSSGKVASYGIVCHLRFHEISSGKKCKARLDMLSILWNTIWFLNVPIAVARAPFANKKTVLNIISFFGHTFKYISINRFAK